MKKENSSSSRVTSPRDFSEVYQRNRRISGAYYVLFHRPNERSIARLGVVASKRKVRTAVSRNRVKRIAREAFRSQQRALRAVDAVIVAKAESGRVSKQQLRQCLDKLLIQLTSA